MPPSDAATRSGLGFGAAAYVLWGLLPVYFILLVPAGPFEIVAWRILFSLITCAIALTVLRAWRGFWALVRSPRILFTMALAGALIFVNWQTYVYATSTDQVVEASLGYFINPVVTVFLGVIVLKERLRALQWIAVGVSILAILVLTLAHGGFPWIALMLAFSFGFYGLVKKQVGRDVDALGGLTLESVWLAPVAVVELIVVGLTSGLTFGTAGAGHAWLLVLAGPVTAVPLLLYAAAARRLPLVHLGLIQYLAPILQFVVGVFVLHERMDSARWTGFALVWCALALLVADLFRYARRRVTDV